MQRSRLSCPTVGDRFAFSARIRLGVLRASARSSPTPETTNPPPASGQLRRCPGSRGRTAYRIDNAVFKFMEFHNIRASQIAVARGGKLAYARAYTLAKKDCPITTALTRMRIGSLSKRITAMQIMRDWQDGHLTPESRIVDLLSGSTTPLSPAARSRLNAVRVKHVLPHLVPEQALGGARST